MTHRAHTLVVLTVQLLLVGGCTAEGDACDELCPVALSAYETCQEQWGLSYGTPGTYESADDYENWCSTWNIERRLLAEDADPDAGLEQLLTQCAAQADSLESGDCSTYHETLDY